MPGHNNYKSASNHLRNYSNWHRNNSEEFQVTSILPTTSCALPIKKEFLKALPRKGATESHTLRLLSSNLILRGQWQKKDSRIKGAKFAIK